MTNTMMITINRDSMLAAMRADLISIRPAAFIDTLDAHDDSAHFAELLMIELIDDSDAFCDIFAIDDDDAYDAALRDARAAITANYDAMHASLTALIDELAARYRA